MRHRRLNRFNSTKLYAVVAMAGFTACADQSRPAPTANPDDPLLPCALEGNCSGETYAQLVKRIRESAAIKIAVSEASTLANEAKRHLANFPDSAYRNALAAIADFTVARTT